jgi:hypothetical protein
VVVFVVVSVVVVAVAVVDAVIVCHCWGEGGYSKGGRGGAINGQRGNG